jgi:hypothetical protein
LAFISRTMKFLLLSYFILVVLPLFYKFVILCCAQFQMFQSLFCATHSSATQKFVNCMWTSFSWFQPAKSNKRDFYSRSMPNKQIFKENFTIGREFQKFLDSTTDSEKKFHTMFFSKMLTLISRPFWTFQ